MLRLARDLPGGPVISLDLNGVSPGEDAASRHEAILAPALRWVDILHANLEEAEAIVGPLGVADLGDRLRALAEWFLGKGVAIVTITLGAQGSFTAVTGKSARLTACLSLARNAGAWAGQHVRAAAFASSPESKVNANGAGDSFIGGLLLATAAWKDKVTLEEAVKFASLAALQRVDGNLRQATPKKTAAELMATVKAGDKELPRTLPLC